MTTDFNFTFNANSKIQNECFMWHYDAFADAR